MYHLDPRCNVRQTGKTAAGLGLTFERLSSGQRINRASDDAAGLAIASDLTADARVFTQGVRNVNDAISTTNIAASAIQELKSIVMRQKELATQSANGVYTTTQRQALDTEAGKLTEEQNRIIATTSFNGISLLTNPDQQLTIQAGRSTITFSLGAALARAQTGIEVGVGSIGQSGFITASQLSTGSSPTAVSVGDLNGDGIPDIVDADISDATVSVIIANGNGTFRARASFANAGNTDRSVNLADVNGDGKLDIISAESNNKASVMLGNGDGSFSSATSFVAGSAAYNALTYDVDGDGKLDILTVDYSNATVSALMGNGNGSFGARRSFGTGSGPADLYISDVDGDGKADLISSDNDDDTASVLLGNGNGTFKARTSFAVNNVTYTAGDLSTADVNGDGKLDVLVALDQSAGGVSVLFGNGNGSFGARTTFASGKNPSGVKYVDMNNDGVSDIVTADFTANGVSVLLGNGNGTFRARISSAAGGNPNDLSILDLNGDGKKDIITANQAGNAIGILFGRGDGTFVDNLEPGYGLTGAPYGIVSSDVNADGKQDLLAVENGTNVISVVLGNGNGTFSARSSFSTGSTPQALYLADLNGDGVQDVATANWTGTVSILLGNGNGSYQSKTSFASGNAQSLYIAALNGDGKQDIVTADTGNNSASILLGNGNGTFAARTSLSVNQAEFAAGADLNGDGKQDLVIAEGVGSQVKAFLGNGNGTFAAGVFYTTYTVPRALALQDLNHDGKLDLVSRDTSSGITVFLGNGNGTFAAHTSFLAANSGSSVCLSDVNGDGNIDVVAGGSNLAEILLGNGDGSFRAREQSETGGQPRIIAVDLNGDGKPDLASANGATANITVQLNYSGQGTSTVQILGASTTSFANINLTTASSALSALSTLDDNLTRLNAELGNLGSTQSRLLHALAVLDVSSHNYSAASGRITDADVASESSNLLRLQILQQAGQAVLAQANQDPRIALQLLAPG